MAANDLRDELEDGAETAGDGYLEDGKTTPSERAYDDDELGTAEEHEGLGDAVSAADTGGEVDECARTLVDPALAHRDRNLRTRWPSPYGWTGTHAWP
jgi:hypothetical protein